MHESMNIKVLYSSYLNAN